MLKKIFSVGVCLGLATSVYAATGNFKAGVINLNQAKSERTKNIAGNQLYVCNLTNMPNQSGTQIRVSFPQTGVADQYPQPGSCAYLSNNNGAFTTQVVIYAPASNANPIYNNNLNSGQMWSVTYNSSNNTYPVAQIQ